MPTYRKDSKLRYVDMAIYIDKEIKKPGCDEEKCFEYMYQLFYILSVKGRMFQTASDYDNYALYGATQLFLRYRKEREPDSKLKPIKSCLNYIKKILYPLKVNYQKSNFFQVFQEGALGGNAPTIIADAKVAEARKLTDDLLKTEYKYYLTQLPSTVKHVLRESPYSNNPVMLHNLYISCLLTLLKMITVSNKNKARLDNKEARCLPMTDLMDKVYAEESKDDVVIYHLEKSMKNYVKLLVNRCKGEIAHDLRYIVGSYELSDSIIKEILTQPLEDYISE